MKSYRRPAWRWNKELEQTTICTTRTTFRSKRNDVAADYARPFASAVCLFLYFMYFLVMSGFSNISDQYVIKQIHAVLKHTSYHAKSEHAPNRTIAIHTKSPYNSHLRFQSIRIYTTRKCH